MKAHLRANLLLLGLTLVICAIAYPALLLGVGKALFAESSSGSLMVDAADNTIGSRLIAQPFTDPRYFWPRPSAVSYNAAATGGSNLGASNPALRKRVLVQLGGLLKYHDGRPVGPDIAQWVREQVASDPQRVAKWKAESPELAEAWAAAGTDGDGAALHGPFFELWWAAHPVADVQPVPADLVMASGSGVDPDITVAAARYQLDRVAAVWANLLSADTAAVKRQIEQLIDAHATAPLRGIAGEPLVNVLELNLAIREALQGDSVTAAESAR
jgi:K+-transporting ATPase ATPase C chain